MEDSKDKPERKPSKRDVRASPKAATLPAGAVLMAHPSEGIFTKIRKCLRLKSKGKYDFSHPESESATATSVARSGSSDSATSLENGRVDKTRVKSSPLKLSRRSSKQDKEEVVLVRKDKWSSFGFRLGVRSAGDVGKDDVLVVHVGDDKENADKIQNGALAPDKAAMSPGSDKNAVNDVFDDFDPDYETLDSVRKKILSQAGPAQDTNGVISASKPKVISAGQQLRTKPTISSDGRDSGLDSPFTDSPGSGRDGQTQSVTSSVFSNSAVFSESSDLRESVHSTSSVLVNGEPVLFTSSIDSSLHPGRPLSNCSNLTLQEDDLYSNSKVMIRKKSQKLSQAFDGSFSPVDSYSADEGGTQPSSTRNSLLLPDILLAVDESYAESLAPPPLPARNYSEEDIVSLSKGAESSCSQKDEQEVPKTFGSTTATHAHDCFVGTGARPKTTNTSFSTQNGFFSSPQNLSVDTNPYADVDDVQPVLAKPDDLQKSDDMYFTSCGNIYEDIPARIDSQENVTESPFKGESKPESDMMFIDEDPDSVDSDSGEKPVPPAVDYDIVPEDVMIVSASDSVCGTEVLGGSHADKSGNNEDNAQETSHFVPAPLHLDKENGSTDNDDNQKNVTETSDNRECLLLKEAKTDLEAERSGLDNDVKCEIKNSELTGASPSAATRQELCAASAAEPHSQNICHNATATSSSSSSSSHQMSASSPASSSSSDTLNDMDNFDPDDLEGKDLNPPSGPPIHMSQRQVFHRADLRWLTIPPPVPPHRQTSGRASNRNAVSMDLTSSLQDGDDQAAGASSARRHSGTSTTAKLHQDFLESMKQLKDCGWYWGPLSYEEAENKLQDKRDGSFLVRDSSNENYILSLSFKSLGQVHHTRIEHHKGLFSFWSQPDSHGKAQICQFIEQTVENSRNGRFLYFLRPMGPGSPPMPIQLLYPVSRFFRVPSLQHMCRFRVLRLVRRDHIDHLPLPQKVKSYLLEKQYYVETLEED